MNPKPLSARRQPGAGFTLIELLVVIVILGILSAIVVFAVRGAGDKGATNALATDARTIRTAQEAFCARYDRYAKSMNELVEGPRNEAGQLEGRGFLSEPSELHSIREAIDEPKPCNGSGYVIWPKQAGGQQPEGDQPLPPGAFADTGNPPFADREVEVLVPLATGKVLAYSLSSYTAGPPRAAVYDPSRGEWDVATQPGADATDRHGVLLIDDPATPDVVECGARCGQVLTHAYTEWFRFNPNGNCSPSPLPPPVGSGPVCGIGTWEKVVAPSYSDGSFFVNGAVVLLDDPATPGLQCSTSCGKVFITSFEDFNDVHADLYDPASDTFERISYPPGKESHFASFSSLTPLADGRVLMLRTAGVNGAGRTALFDPQGLGFEDATASTLSPAVAGSRSALLPNGDVLFTSLDGGSVIYRPQPRGQGGGLWLAGPTCAPAGATCQIMTSLGGGRVLARVGATGAARLYNPQTGKWGEAASMRPSSAGVGAYIKPGTSACAPNCGKVLVAKTTAELYTPP